VSGIEELIRMLKERIQKTANQSPFDTYPHRLIVEMVYNIVFGINSFLHKDGIYTYINPCTIITGLHIDHNKHCKLEIGTYVCMHEEHDN